MGRAQWQVRGRPEWLLSLPGGSRGAHGLPAGVMGSGEALGLARRARGRGESPAGGGAGWVRALGLPGGRGCRWEQRGRGARPGRHLPLVLWISGWSLGQQRYQAD